MSYPRATNMTSRSGNAVPNQIEIRTDSEIIFQSYGTTIAVKTYDGDVTLNENYWDYSATTGKYRNEFLNEGIAETRRKIADGTYKLVKM